MKYICPYCNSQNINSGVEAIDGRILFWTECNDCGFDKFVEIEDSMLMSFLNVTHYDWVQGINVYGHRLGTSLHYKPMPYYEVRDTYNEEDVDAFKSNL